MCLLKCCLCRIEKDNLFFYKLVLNRFFYKDINDYIISFLRPDYRYDYNKVIHNIKFFHIEGCILCLKKSKVLYYINKNSILFLIKLNRLNINYNKNIIKRYYYNQIYFDVNYK